MMIKGQLLKLKKISKRPWVETKSSLLLNKIMSKNKLLQHRKLPQKRKFQNLRLKKNLMPKKPKPHQQKNQILKLQTKLELNLPLKEVLERMMVKWMPLQWNNTQKVQLRLPILLMEANQKRRRLTNTILISCNLIHRLTISQS